MENYELRNIEMLKLQKEREMQRRWEQALLTGWSRSHRQDLLSSLNHVEFPTSQGSD